MAKKDPISSYQLIIMLKNIEPAIWRRILVPSDIKLSVFHDVLQIVMGWDNYHLHEYVIGKMKYGIPDDDYGMDIKNEKRYKLSQLLKKEKESLLYKYDFGDGWNHDIILEKILPRDASIAKVRCIEGKRACPPEDCGSFFGYYKLVEAIQDPSHPEHKVLLDWVGEYDPEYFNIERINKILSGYKG